MASKKSKKMHFTIEKTVRVFYIEVHPADASAVLVNTDFRN